MEEKNASNADLIVSLLSQGNNQIAQLEAMVDEPCKPLARQIQIIIQQSISLAKSVDSEGSWQPPVAVCPSNAPPGSPGTNTVSPQSEISDRIIKVHEPNKMSKKRKLPRWTNQVRVPWSGEVEGVLNDGFSWRKYGQKDILGARHPRSYYRCTHKKTLGCPATKHMQKSDDDPSVLDINYRGEHTCCQKQPPAAAAATAAETIAFDGAGDDHHQLLLSFKTNLKVKTDEDDMEDHQYCMKPSAASSSSSFSFQASSTSAGNHMIMNFSSAPPTLESHFMDGASGGVGFSSPSPFNVVSPAASDLLNYANTFLAGFQCQTGSPCGHEAGGMALLNTAAPEYELTEIFNAVNYTSSTSSLMVDSSPYMLDHYPFDASNFYGEI